MIKEGTKIEFESGRQYEVIKVFTQKLVDLRALKPEFEWMPDYFPIYLSVGLKNYKILNEHHGETPIVIENKDKRNICHSLTYCENFKEGLHNRKCKKCSKYGVA